MNRLFAKRMIYSLMVAVLLLLAACATNEPPNSNTPFADSDLESLAANPLDVSIELETSRKVSKKISPSGGSLTATASDGTIFTLTLPKNAVLSDLQVSMTPIHSVNNLPLTGGYIGAVHLEPEGMEFLEPVKLTIQTNKTFDANKLTGFNSHEMGKEFYLQHRAVSGQTITLSLMHFSNPGAAVVTDPDLDLLVPLVPSDLRDRFEHSITVSEITVRPVTVRIDNFYAQVKTRLESALTDDTKLKRAIREFLTWRKLVSELGLTDAYKAKIFQGWTLVAQGIEGAVEKAYAKCVVNDDFTNVVDILGWISWVKRNPRLAPYFEGKLAAFEEKASKCATFELSFNYEVQQNTNRDLPGLPDFTNINSSHKVQTKFDVSYSFLEETLVGQAPLESIVFTASGYTGKVGPSVQCTVKENGSELIRDFKAAKFSASQKSTLPLANLLIDPKNATIRKMLSLVVDFGFVEESFVHTCQNQSPVILLGIESHVGAYANFWPLHNFDPKGIPMNFIGSVAEYQKIHNYRGRPFTSPQTTDTTLTVTGSTTLTLRHTPQ